MTIEPELLGLKETQQRMTQLLEDLSVKNGLLGIMAKATLRAHSYVTKIVHVLTGRLKNSLFPRSYTRANQAYGVVGTNVIYARVEQDRGGDHAYFERTIDEEGPAIVDMVEADVAKAVNQAGGG